MSIHEQDTEPMPILPHLSASHIDYRWLKEFSDRSGIRLLHAYRIALGLQVREVRRVARPLLTPRTRQ